jgi:hypothetical protein
MCVYRNIGKSLTFIWALNPVLEVLRRSLSFAPNQPTFTTGPLGLPPPHRCFVSMACGPHPPALSSPPFPLHPVTPRVGQTAVPRARSAPMATEWRMVSTCPGTTSRPLTCPATSRNFSQFRPLPPVEGKKRKEGRGGAFGGASSKIWRRSCCGPALPHPPDLCSGQVQ